MSRPDADLTTWVSQLLADPSMRRMGHDQRLDDLNLGLGWLYYAMGRILRPRHALVIGSYRGFVPLVLAKSMRDNLEPGTVTFIDPSMVDDFWKDPAAVDAHFHSFGVAPVRHFRMTTQEFVETEAYRDLEPIDVLFIDGYHSYEQAKFDHASFRDRVQASGVVFFHDSILVGQSRIYGPGGEYDLGVPDYLDELRRDPRYALFDIPIASGVTMVRTVDDPLKGARVLFERPKHKQAPQ